MSLINFVFFVYIMNYFSFEVKVASDIVLIAGIKVLFYVMGVGDQF